MRLDYKLELDEINGSYTSNFLALTLIKTMSAGLKRLEPVETSFHHSLFSSLTVYEQAGSIIKQNGHIYGVCETGYTTDLLAYQWIQRFH
jgi:hypothetical protein